MAGDFAAIAAALTRTPALDSRARPAGGSVPASGNVAAQSGESLPVPAAPPPPPVVDVAKAVERLNQLMSSHERSLRFAIDPSSGRTVITVINDETQEVVRQIPSEDLLQLARELQDLGPLIDAHA